MAYQTIQFVKEEDIATITLNRSEKLNALSKQVRAEIRDALQKTIEDEEARVVIFCGNKVFSVGADLEEARNIQSVQDGYNFSREFQKLFQEIENFPLPTLAAINGFALGGGCELALACDFRIAADNARIGVPEIDLGAFPAGSGTQKLPRYIGVTRAKEMLYIGEPIDAQEAWRIGLINKVVPADELMNEAKKFAKKLASKPKIALATLKSLVNTGMNIDLTSALELEAKNFAALASSPEMRRGVEAFFKRKEAKS